MELNKIYCEDCRETMKRMPDNFVDLVVTSPPYDDLRDYHGCDWNMKIFQQIADEMFRIMKPGGVVVWIVNDKTNNGSETQTSFLQSIYFRFFAGFQLHDTMIWNKNSCRYPETNRYYPCFEYMFVFSKNSPKTYNLIEDRKNIYSGSKVARAKQMRKTDGEIVENSAFRNDKNRKIKDIGARFNIWEIPVSASTDDKIALLHPGTFPEKLAADHIYSWSNEGDLIYDPFGGSGTTAKMAHLMQRNWIISEISEKYVEEVTKPRLEPYLKQVSIFDILNSAS